MSRNLIILLAVLTLSLIVGFIFKPKTETPTNQNSNTTTEEKNWKKTQIKLGDKNYEIFVTETDQNRKLGLSVFENILDNQGMLFEFEEENYHAFWMKDMKFDIDIIFLDKDKKVIQIFENVQKSSYINDNKFETFIPKLKSKYVIEINSGETRKNNLRPGSVIIF